MNSGLSFDGTDDVVETADTAPLNITNTISASFWIYPDVTGVKNILSRRSGCGSGGIQYQLNINSNRTVQWATGNPVGIATSANRVELNTWNFLAVTYSATARRGAFFINGFYETFGNAGGMETVATTVKIGQSGSCPSSEAFDGKIDDVRVYNYVLDIDQIRKVMNDGAAVRFGPDTGQP